MDFKQLRYFMVTAQLGSFTAASVALRVSQPGLGTLVRKLEEELQTELLVRHSRGVELTDAGSYLLRRAEHLFAYLDETASEMSRFADAPRGLVRLGLNPAMEFGYGAELLRRCHELHPGIKIDILEAFSHKIEQFLIGGVIDIGISYAFGEHSPDLVAERVRMEDAAFVREFREDAGEQITFAELCDFPLVLAPQSHGLHEKIQEVAAASGCDPKVHYEVESIGTMMEVVRIGLAGTILPFGAIQTMVQQKKVSASRIVEPRFSMSLDVSMRSGAASSQAALLVRETLISMLRNESQLPGPVMAG